ncbi:ABC transporter permease [Patulibacter sp.]|uniref:ABC transporter permease n=1 Tax=Patulibacter sp. TaxID=1912859 RepID=UPI002717B172|nr:ABC transporter permease [Patulibacter sp.]MDO9408761.1 ABC transporter permease [Patulibacter sp.]
MNPRVRALVRREFRERTRTKAFLIISVIGAIAVAFLTVLPALVDELSTPDPVVVAVESPASGQVSALRDALPERLDDGGRRYDVRAAADAKDPDLRLRLRTSGDRVTGVEVRGEDVEGDDARTVVAGVQQLALAGRLQAAGVDAGRTLRPVPVRAVSTDDGPDDTKQALAYALVLLLYLTLLAYGSSVSTAVVSEKSARVTETLLVAVSPREHLLGKLLGTGAVGLVQYGGWIVVAAITRAIAGAAGLGDSLGALTPGVAVAFVGFFLLGFGLFGTLYAAMCVGASRVEDAASASAPLAIPLIGGFALSLAALGDPDGATAVVGGFIPFTAPMVMFTRVALGDPSVLSVVVSVLGILLASGVALSVAFRIYGAGLLRYGNGAGLGQLLRRAGTR